MDMLGVYVSVNEGQIYSTELLGIGRPGSLGQATSTGISPGTAGSATETTSS